MRTKKRKARRRKRTVDLGKKLALPITVPDLLFSVRYGHRNHGEECKTCARNADALEAYIGMLERQLSASRIPEREE